jgi:hypothetical protein
MILRMKPARCNKALRRDSVPEASTFAVHEQETFSVGARVFPKSATNTRE